MGNLLVVVPCRGSAAYLWTLEYAINMKESGENVYLMDLASIESAYSESRFRWHLERFSRKNSFPNSVERILKEHGINQLKLKDFKVEYSKENDIKSDPIFQKALRSQYAKWHGDSSITISDIPTAIVEREGVAFLRGFSVTQQAIQIFKINQMATVNGRFVTQAACVYASIKQGVEYRLLESIDLPGIRMSVFSNSLHSVTENRIMMKKSWESATIDSRKLAEEVAIKAIEERLSPNWIWKTKNPIESALESNSYISYFPTSDVELAVFDSNEETKSQLNQAEVFTLAARAANELGLQMVVRVHPQPLEEHLAYREDEIWKKLCSDNNALCISSKSSIDSIKLAKNSRLNIVFASSIALEIGYLGLPLIVTAPTIYSCLIPECEALDEERILSAIACPPTLTSKTQIFPYLYYEKMGGAPFVNFEVINMNHAVYNGIWLDEPRLLIFKARRFLSTFRERFSQKKFMGTLADRNNELLVKED